MTDSQRDQPPSPLYLDHRPPMTLTATPPVRALDELEHQAANDIHFIGITFSSARVSGTAEG